MSLPQSSSWAPFPVLSDSPIKFDAALAVYVLAGLFTLYLTFSLVGQFQQLPTFLYGGDLTNGLGGVVHILDGGSPLDSSQMLGQVPWVPWFYHLSVSIFAKLTGLTPVMALIDFSYVIQLGCLVVIYFFVREFTDNPYVPALVALAYFPTTHFPVFKYTPFSYVLIMPIFVLLLYWFIKQPDWKHAIPTGLALGFATMSNTQAFFMAFITLFAAALVFLGPKLFDLSQKRLRPLDQDSTSQLKLYALIFALGFLISLLFWFQPLFVFHGQTPNDIQNITTIDLTVFANFLNHMAGLFGYFLLPYPAGLLLVFSAVFLLGIYYAYQSRAALPARFALVIALAWFLAYIHPVITLPLFHQHLVNHMLVNQLSHVLLLAFIPLGFTFILRKLPAKPGNPQLYQNAFLAIIFLMAIVYSTDHWQTRQAFQLETIGKTPLAPPFVELTAWIRANTSVNDVILTTNEDGFMMNGLTGRKIVSYRRAHASPYINLHERMADQAVMVYGTDDVKRVELLDKYNVTYLLWSDRWVLNEFQFDANGQFRGFFDPLTVPAKPEYDAYWNATGVQHQRAVFGMDPAPPPGAPVYDQYIATPYELSEEPLNPQIYTHFTLVKKVTYNGHDYFRIYERKQA